MTKGKLRVEDVTPGSEADLRHFVESAVLKANAECAPDDEDDGGDDERSAEDRDMTERLDDPSIPPWGAASSAMPGA